jgi:uncharacterized lipoprotein YbaY
MKRKIITGVVAALCVVSVAMYTSTAAPPKGRDPGPGAPTVSGTVSLGKTPYNDRMALPGMAMVHVELLDVTGKDPRTATIGKQTVWPAWAPLPVDFRIEYDPSRIDPTHAYVVRARIMDGDEILFVSIKPYYVLTKGAPSKVDIIVIPAQVRVR